MALLQSLQPELVHRALIIVLNMLSVEAEEARQEAAIGLCEASLLPVMSVIIQELKGKVDVQYALRTSHITVSAISEQAVPS